MSLFVPSLTRGGGGAKERVVTVSISQGQKIVLGIDKDEVPALMTYGRYLDLEEEGSKGVPPDELAVPGVDVHYRVAMPGYGEGAPFQTRFTLYDQRGAPGPSKDADATLDADSDECDCSEFVPVPLGPKSYRVRVAVFRPGARYAAPVVAQYTNFFSAAGPVNG